MKIPPRVKVFSQLVFKQIILTRDVLNHQKCTCEPNCMFCSKDQPTDQCQCIRCSFEYFHIVLDFCLDYLDCREGLRQLGLQDCCLFGVQRFGPRAPWSLFFNWKNIFLSFKNPKINHRYRQWIFLPLCKKSIRRIMYFGLCKNSKFLNLRL